ncbi:hypothetical protein BIV60_10215 [Bacillus sp. MUM 116]|nr:hypothetical protein BIV60_10215 [Bacillus sp. MUM 116]
MNTSNTKTIQPKRLVISAITALAILRILNSYNWLNGAFVGKDSKFAPDFLSGAGLASRINGGFVHTAINSGVASFLTDTVVPHASIFAWMLALGEACVGFSLLLGLFTRVGGFFAFTQGLVNILVVFGGGADTIGQNYLLMVLGLIFILTSPGRVFGLDGLLLKKFPNFRILKYLC